MRGQIHTLQMDNVPYVEVPHAILRFKHEGFNVKDINIIPHGPHAYDMWASKTI